MDKICRVMPEPALAMLRARVISHAYYCHNQAMVVECIKSAYAQAIASGNNDFLDIMGNTQGGFKPYGASNHMEFFPDTSEAFFSNKRLLNVYFPYIHDELRGFYVA